MSDDKYGPGELDDLCNDVHGDLAKRLRDYDGSMLTKQITLGEVIDSDGERFVVMLADPDLRAHDTLGLLNHAIEVERAGIIINGGRDGA